LSGQLSNRVTFNGPTQSSFRKHGTRWLCFMTQLKTWHPLDVFHDSVDLDPWLRRFEKSPRRSSWSQSTNQESHQNKAHQKYEPFRIYATTVLPPSRFVLASQEIYSIRETHRRLGVHSAKLASSAKSPTTSNMSKRVSVSFKINFRLSPNS
jgi:hypothetical protein